VKSVLSTKSRVLSFASTQNSALELSTLFLNNR